MQDCGHGAGRLLLPHTCPFFARTKALDCIIGAMHPVLEQRRAEIAQVCRHHHVARLEVFGSGARGTDFDPETSDADFLVVFESQQKKGLGTYYALKSALEALLARQVDLVEPGALRNPYVLAGINEAREVVYPA